MTDRELPLTDERIREIAQDACSLKMDGKREYQSIQFSIEQAIRQALKEALEWRDMESAPKSGEFLIEVYEGEWRNPKQRRRIYHATADLSGLSWAMKGNYRTLEGEAYLLSGWLPLPPSKE